MSDVTKPIVLDESYREFMEAQNHLLAHQNAAIDLLASDKRADVLSDISEIAHLAKNGELLEVMDYGDQISAGWANGQTNYTPAMNLCHESDELLEDGETVHGCFFEWDKVTPYGIVYDEPEAIFESTSPLAAGTHHFKIVNDSWGGNEGKFIQFTAPEEIPAGYQIRKSVGYNGSVLSGTLDVYANGESRTKLYSMTPTEGTGGTDLGETDGTGDLNHWHRVALGDSRWKYSFARQILNAIGEKNTYYVQTHKWDVKPAMAETTDGFLHGYSEGIYKYFKPIKVVTVEPNIDGNVEDVTYDRVFLSSLEQMYAAPQFAGKEGEYWEYYKRLLGRTTPAPLYQTYTRLIKYALDAPTSAQAYWRRSAGRSYGCSVFSVTSSGYLTNVNAIDAYRCAPSVFISD